MTGSLPQAASGGTRTALERIGAVYDHVAHAVASIAEVLPLYRDVLGGVPVSGGISPWGGHLAVQFEFAPGARIELLEPVRPDAPSIGTFLTRSPRGGLHHVTFKVPDIEQAIAVVTELGYEVVATMTDNEQWRETFLHPRGTGGILLQLAQAADGVPGPLPKPLDDLLDEARASRIRHGMAG